MQEGKNSILQSWKQERSSNDTSVSVRKLHLHAKLLRELEESKRTNTMKTGLTNFCP